MKEEADVLDRILVRSGYKFLGWQNGWRHIFLDKCGQETDDMAKAVSFNYVPSEHNEYFWCLGQGHKPDEVQHNPRGSENTVSCDICKIYWKYDCSD
jgi:hypothetical protein